MPLKVEADSGYGSVLGPGPGLGGSLGTSETLPLLIPDDEPATHYLKPMTRDELAAAAGGPGWRKFRYRLVLLFWLGWLTILGIAIIDIVQSPRPATRHLHWWQKELFYRLQPAVFLDVESTGSGAINRLSERLPYLKSLGVGVMVLEGFFSTEVSLLNLTDQRFGTLPEFHQFLANSHTAGMRVILDLCNGTETNASDYVQDSLRYWLERGVSGFEICNTDPAFTEKTLKRWRDVVKEFSSDDDERIMMVRQISDSVPGSNNSDSAINSSLVALVSRSLIPPSSHPLSTPEVAEAMESKLKTLHGEWPSWSVYGEAGVNTSFTSERQSTPLAKTEVDGPVAWMLQKLIMVLMMTLPGTPIIRYGDEINQAPNLDQLKGSTALFHSLSHTRSHEEALLHGSFSLLTFNATSLNVGSVNSTATPPMGFLRSWGCVHFLVLFNLGSGSHALNSSWSLTLPESGMFVTSTGLDRLGPVILQSITLQPHEAVVIKLFETDPDF